MSTAQAYQEAIDAIADLADRTFGDAVTAIYAGGSVGRGDFVPGRSDLDVYVVLREPDEHLETRFRNQVADIETEYLSELQHVDPDPLSVAFTTESAIDRGESFLGVGFEYEEFLENGELVYGTDIKHRLPEPSQEAVRRSAHVALEAIETRADRTTDRFTKYLFGLIFRSLCAFLGGTGEPTGSKSRAVAACRGRFDEDPTLLEDIERAYELYERWADRSLTDEEFFELHELSQEIVPEIVARWNRNYAPSND